MAVSCLFVQVLLSVMVCIYCQQFNNPVPPRFLIPGSIPVFQLQQSQPQPRRLPIDAENDSSLPKIKRPIGRARVIPSAPASLVPLQTEPLPTVTTQRISQVPENISLSPRPVVEREEEEEEEDDGPTIASTILTSTTSPSISRSFSPSTYQFRPSSKPPQQSPSFVTTNIIDEDETAQTARQPIISSTTLDESRQFQRKQLTPRIQGFRPSPVAQQGFFEKPRQQPQQPQFEKPLKQKYEKLDVPEKRARKPVAQVLRRYREDNPDGSITWGFENDDGSYKEEAIGNDCVTRGKYGYVDPDGVKREYSYTSGLPCDKNKLEQTAESANNPAGYVDYSSNRVVLPNGDSVDLNQMVKNRARKPVAKFRN